MVCEPEKLAFMTTLGSCFDGRGFTSSRSQGALSKARWLLWGASVESTAQRMAIGVALVPDVCNAALGQQGFDSASERVRI